MTRFVSVLKRLMHSSVVEGTVSGGVKVITVPVLNDNYSYLLTKPESVAAVCVDPGDAGPVLTVLEREGLTLESVLLTHKHADHVDGVDQLLDRFPECKLVGPGEVPVVRARAGSLVAGPNDRFCVLRDVPVTALDTGCHTLGHLAYHLPANDVVFTGDCLFVCGTGRFFEGTADQMFQSLARLKQLDPETLVFAGHEYTVKNLEFCLSLEPENGRLVERMVRAQERRNNRLPTMPTTVADELATNPFLRTDEKQLAKRLGFVEFSPANDSDQIELLASLRLKKDQF